MNDKKWEMFTAIDKNGFYWDERIGKCYYPEVFVNEQTAKAHCQSIKERWNVIVKATKIKVSI